MKYITYKLLKKEKPQELTVGCIGTGSLFGFFIFSAISRDFEKFLLMDGDSFEIKNMLKNPWFHPADQGMLKVKYWQSKINLYLPNATINTYPFFFNLKEHEDFIKKSDIIVLGVDNNSTRINVQLGCLRNSKPLIDTASGIYADEKDKITESGMRVRVYTPGNPCVYCQGTRVRADESEFLKSIPGYVIGSSTLKDTSVSLNQMAGAITSEILVRLCKGIEIPIEIRYDELKFNLFTISHFKDTECSVCSHG